MSEDNQQAHAPAQDSKWQRDTIEKLASSALAEQKTSRRWSIFFKALIFIYLFIILFYALGVFGGGKKVQHFTLR